MSVFVILLGSCTVWSHPVRCAEHGVAVSNSETEGFLVNRICSLSRFCSHESSTPGFCVFATALC